MDGLELERTPGEVAVKRINGERGAGVFSPASPHKRTPLPAGNRYFPDPERETTARAISWAMAKGGDSAIFATLTHRNEVSVAKNDKMVRRWLAKAQQSLRDKGGGQLKSFCATEWQKRGVIHDHLLLVGNGLDALSKKRLEHRWEVDGGGFARCYEADKAAAPYLAKYTSKRLGGEVDWGGSWQGLNIPASVSRLQAGAPS